MADKIFIINNELFHACTNEVKTRGEINLDYQAIFCMLKNHYKLLAVWMALTVLRKISEAGFQLCASLFHCKSDFSDRVCS